MQKTGGQMKTCDVKNRIFSRRRVPFMGLCTYGDKNRHFVEIKIKALVCCSTFSAKEITCNISLSKGTSERFVGDQYKRNRTSKNSKIEALVCSSSFSVKRKSCKKRNIAALVCASTFSAKQRTQEAKWQKTKRKNAEDEWANEEMSC